VVVAGVARQAPYHLNVLVRFPPVPPGPPIRVSASTYSTYLQCPDAALARLRGEYGPDSPASFKGGLAHRIFARHLTKGTIAPEEFEQVCRQEIGGSTLNHKMAALHLKPSELRELIAEMSAMYERFTRLPQEGFVGAEVELAVEPTEGVELVGSIDAVYEADGSVRLVDWKTGDLGDPEPQLRFYAMGWALDRQRPPSVIEAVSVRTGERLSFETDQESIEHTAGLVAELVGAVRAAWMSGTEIGRRGGPGCGYCPLLESCAEGRAALTVLSQTSTSR
jgi:hypothetical protein